MKKIIIMNGPNLNLLGKREPTVYGHTSFDDYFTSLQEQYKGKCNLYYYQSNHEGALIDKIHEVGFDFDGIVLNAGAYTHTSIALHDAIKAVVTPVIEVHISNIHAREEFRHRSMIAAACKGSIAGLGLESYKLAIDYFIITNNTPI
ncbi:type II 3-dehydroquinate dehydratase [Dysgonomonas sp. 520]|uniref:type II 3-dehydroquinate dehydratase n=1 Tax=Dysgonomonas sp. 520 TaxID=2302931 RepID=UPI0013D2EE73|nr:type II 3-dehydroquinate dehydratase [Dysgonomonas sp. 520]NDW08809.1 type II 3-dehydroquinate dehydratase [Dysgonomonas sp. 520]